MAAKKNTKLPSTKKQISKPAAAALQATSSQPAITALLKVKKSVSSQRTSKPAVAPANTKPAQIKTAVKTSSASSKPVTVTPSPTLALEETQKPDRQPEETWPKSRIIASTTITASDCRVLYRLNANDLAPLKFTIEPSPNDRPRPMHLYTELEVERTAWRKHGGPAGWQWYLNKLRATYRKKHPEGVFPEPRGRNTKPCTTCGKRIWDTAAGFYSKTPLCFLCQMNAGGIPVEDESSCDHGDDPFGLFTCCDHRNYGDNDDYVEDEDEDEDMEYDENYYERDPSDEEDEDQGDHDN
ncbi:hypothetical protein BV25DRAFT_1951402 [Artomyces pyxidatus]|uniref:Uncharacterized protein n=1 Tax=Artomyces pyxidatus TaxID=48021 RepID=A0ACB8SYW9_9AGAM|nr:hypothetical protein BV25DRAFT_1951402 [Artomyces pyxidatus]